MNSLLCSKSKQTLSCCSFLTYIGLKFGDHDTYEIIEIGYKAFI